MNQQSYWYATSRSKKLVLEELKVIDENDNLIAFEYIGRDYKPIYFKSDLRNNGLGKTKEEALFLYRERLQRAINFEELAIKEYQDLISQINQQL